MSNIVKREQVAVCSEGAKGIFRAANELKLVAGALREQGLDSDATEVAHLGTLLRNKASELESKARATFVAARQGKELPK